MLLFFLVYPYLGLLSNFKIISIKINCKNMSFKYLFQQSIVVITAGVQHPDVRNPIAVSLGAIAGALSRYYLSLWFMQRFGTSFPYGTFFINLSGCLIMGFFVTLTLERIPSIPHEVKLLVATGFLGSYTTFSTYGLESFLIFTNKRIFIGSFYWLGSAFLGIICVQLGVILARLGSRE
jgi:fluoride exporter